MQVSELEVPGSRRTIPGGPNRPCKCANSRSPTDRCTPAVPTGRGSRSETCEDRLAAQRRLQLKGNDCPIPEIMELTSVRTNRSEMCGELLLHVMYANGLATGELIMAG